MSYILDALRKAEHERSIGDAPRLTFSPLSDASNKKPLVLWLLVATLGIAVGVLGAMQLTRDEPGSEVVEKPSDIQQAMPSSASQEIRKSAPRAVVVVAPEEVKPVEQKPTSRPVQVNTPQGPIEVEMPMSQEQSATPPEPVKAPAFKETTEASKTPVARPVQETKAAPASPAPSPVAGSAPEAESAEARAKAANLQIPSAADLAAEYEGGTQVDEPAESSDIAAEPAADFPEPEPEVQEIKTYYGLPSSTRNSIGDLSMNAHVYSSTPGRGFVMINGSRYRVGDRLAEGPTLVEILQDGALLDYRNQLFLLPVPR